MPSPKKIDRGNTLKFIFILILFEISIKKFRESYLFGFFISSTT